MPDDALPEILSPKLDFVFKQLFGDAENIDPLAAFLQAALDLPKEEFEDLFIVDPNLNSEFGGDKHCILDVRIKTRSGRNIDVEIQVRPTDDLHNRIQCYTAKMVAGQVKAGENYSSMSQSVTIVIADFVLWDWNMRYHHRFRLYEADEKFAYPNSMEIHTLELPKLPERSDGTKLWNWLKFMSAETKDEFESLAEGDTVMAKTLVRLMELSADEKARMYAEARGKWEWDNNSRMRQMRREGREEGLEEGLAKGLEKGQVTAQTNIARELLLLQLSLDSIAKATGLSKAEIEELAKTTE